MSGNTSRDVDEPFKCPECNRWSDRGEGKKYVQIADSDPHGSEDAYAACLAPDCRAYMFQLGSGSAFGLLNVQSIRNKRGKSLRAVKKDKLSSYSRLDWPY